MKTMGRVFLAAIVALFGFIGVASATSVDLGDALWYTDRYTPAGFSESGGVLTETIKATDRLSVRPAAYQSTFYDTQGKKHDFGAGVTSMSIELYVDAGWRALGGQRIAGFWGTAVNSLSAISSYPILEIAGSTAGFYFQGWNDVSGWVNYGLPTSFAVNAWHELEIALNGANWDYILDGTLLGRVGAMGSVALDNTILQGYNKFASAEGSYDIKWRNLQANPENRVPEPGSLALLALGFVGLTASRRKAKSK